MKKRKTILTLCLLCATSLAATAYVKASWEGWDTEKQDDAWTVLDLTEWTEFASLGTIPSVITTYSATASVNTAVRDYEAQIKAEFKSYSQDYSGYTELLLAICYLRTQGSGNDIFAITDLPKYEGKSDLTAEESIAAACRLLVACVRESEEVNPYKLDAKLQAVIIAWYSNDPSVIDFFTDQKYTAGEYETYMEREGITLDYKNILQSINAIYSCKEVNMTGSSGYSGSVAAGIAGTIDSGTRLSWLFPGGTPKSPTEVQAYLTTITVPIQTKTGKTTMSLRVHKQLANEIQSIFEELLTVQGFYVNPGDTFGYNWRPMASGTGKLSHHSYGCVIDLNANANPPSYWNSKPDSKSPYYNNPQVVAIFKAHGFYWGGDWSPSFYDPMHFTYTNH